MQFRKDGKQNSLRIQCREPNSKKKTSVNLVRILSHYLFNEYKFSEKTSTEIQIM